MNTHYFDKSPEESRKNAIQSARESVLGKKETTRLDATSLLSTNSIDSSNLFWGTNPEILANPFTYSSVHKNMVADLAGLLSGGSVLSDAVNKLIQSQQNEIAALEKALSQIEGDIAIAKAIREADLVGPEVWYPNWKENRDKTYTSNEPGLFGETNPPPAYVDENTGLLTLPVTSSQQIYGPKQSGRLRIMDSAGGDLQENKEQLSEFEYFPIKLHSKSTTSPNKFTIPWINSNLNGPCIRLRIDLDTPGVFSRINICAGERYHTLPGNLYWYPFGNEGPANILPDPLFNNTYTNSSQRWTLKGNGAFCRIAGTDTGQRLTDSYLSGSSSTLLVLSPGLSEYTSNNEQYTNPCSAYQMFIPPPNGGPLRLFIRWRGRGRHISGKNCFVTVQFYKDFNNNNLLAEQRYELSEGLARASVPPAKEFSISRFLVYAPVGALNAVVILSATRPEEYTDTLQSSYIEIPQIYIDAFAGNIYNWQAPSPGQPGEHPSYVTSIPYQPEAYFFEIVLSQTAYEKEPDALGFYGRQYDFSLRNITIENVEFSRTGRWVSTPHKFEGEPRRFQLVLSDNIVANGTTEFKLSLRPGERSFVIDKNLPLQVISNEESSTGFSDNTVVYNVHDITETFPEGTDLSGRIKLRYYPHINKEKVLALSSQLTANSRRIEYDPNAINPLVYTV